MQLYTCTNARQDVSTPGRLRRVYAFVTNRWTQSRVGPRRDVNALPYPFPGIGSLPRREPSG
jgi:hypothetical protein